MNGNRFVGAIALAMALTGCAGTKDIDPGASAALKNGKASTSSPVAKPDAPDLPARVAAAPLYLPTTPVAPERIAPPVYVPAPVKAQRYEPVETVSVQQPTYEPIETATALPLEEPSPSEYVPVGDLGIPAEPVVVEAAPAYEPVAAVPAPGIRAMAPIRDDPDDDLNDRRAADIETRQHARKGYRRNAALRAGGLKAKIRSNYTPAFGLELEQAALGRINPSVRYDARYVKIAYPMGDVDESTGVCTDVVIRSYRKLGIDLQQMVHEDMKRAFRAYPSKRIYGLTEADANIDHRRVVNLEAFFERTGASVPVGSEPDDFRPGDVLTWRLSGNEPHIGIVVSDRDPRSGYPLVVHNLGAGVRKDDLVSLSPPVGHFRFAPDRQTVVAALIRKER